jgi:hypothetical protein
MRIYLDDTRDPPLFDANGELTHWHVCRTAREAIKFIEGGEVSFISFDHDLGEDLTGYDVAKRIEELAFAGSLSPIDYSIHSGNLIGAANIDRAMKAAWNTWNNRRDHACNR